jgi:hypothetical protein
MLVLVFGLLLTATIDHAAAIQCITNCTVDGLKFGDSFNFPGARCQQRIFGSNCTVLINFNYHERQYTVELGKNLSSADLIYITPSLPYLSYKINHYCSDRTKCVFKNIQKKIDKMVRRSYNATDIYAQLEPLIQGSSQNDPIECYNNKTKIVQCAHNQICGLSYDQQKQEIRARGCHSAHGPRVFVYDAEYYSALHIDCTRNLCNDEETLTKVKSILAKNGLTDANARRIAAGTKEIVSFPLLIFALIFAIIFYF